MPEVPIINNENTICLDVCTKCFFVWFDGTEYESLPKIQKEPENELSPEAQKALAQFKVMIASQKDEYSVDNNWIDLGDIVVETVLYLILEMF